MGRATGCRAAARWRAGREGEDERARGPDVVRRSSVSCDTWLAVLGRLSWDANAGRPRTLPVMGHLVVRRETAATPYRRPSQWPVRLISVCWCYLKKARPATPPARRTTRVLRRRRSRRRTPRHATPTPASHDASRRRTPCQRPTTHPVMGRDDKYIPRRPAPRPMTPPRDGCPMMPGAHHTTGGAFSRCQMALRTGI